MVFRSHKVVVFRVCLVAALVVILHLATTRLDYPVVDKMNDKFSHIMAFYALALLVDFAFPRTRFDLTKALILLSYGILIEFIQYFLPYRTASLYDLGADVIGLLLYQLSIPVLKRMPLLRLRWSMRVFGPAPPGG